MSEMAFSARPALAGLPPLAATTGVRVEEVVHAGLATVMVGASGVAALGGRVRELLGIDLPSGPMSSGSEGVTLVGTGPGVWLATQAGAGFQLADRLARGLEGVASVSDQSSGYTLLRLTGPHARDVLQKGVPIDLHPTAFPANGAAVTVIGGLGTVLWQAAPDTFEVAFFRSMTGSFHHWLATALTGG